MRKRLYYKNFKKITLKEISVIVISIIVLTAFVFGGIYSVPKIVHKYKNYVKHKQEQLLKEQQEAEKQELDRIEKEKQEQERLEAQRNTDINNYKQNFISKLNEFYNPAKNGEFVLPLIMKTTVSSDGSIKYSDIYSKDGNGSEVFTIAKTALSNMNKEPLPKTYNNDSIVMYILFKYDKASLYDSETEPEYAPSYTKEEALNILKDVYTKQIKSEWKFNSMPFYRVKKGTAIIDGTITASGRILDRYLIESSSTEYGSNADYILHSCGIGRDNMPSSIKPDSVNLRFVFKDNDVTVTEPTKISSQKIKINTTIQKEEKKETVSPELLNRQISDYKKNAFNIIKGYWSPTSDSENSSGAIASITIGKDGKLEHFGWDFCCPIGSDALLNAIKKVLDTGVYFGKFPEGYDKDYINFKIRGRATRLELIE